MNKNTSYIPEGFHSVTAYLVGLGTTRLMEFLKEAFGAQETFRMSRPDGTIGHASMRIGDSALEMADPMEGGKPMTSALHLYVPNVDEVYRRALETGAGFLFQPPEIPPSGRGGGGQDNAAADGYIATHTSSGLAPEGFRTITPGLSAVGALELLEFVKKAFAANVVEKDQAANGTVGHATFQIGDSVVECSEAHGQWGPRTATLHV